VAKNTEVQKLLEVRVNAAGVNDGVKM